MLGTPGLVDYWRLGETSGSAFADSVGGNPAAIVGDPTLGVNGGVPNDSDKAARFDGVNDAASAPVSGLAGKTAATVEFWLKWNSWGNNDELAMELTNNFNSTPGGFLVDPNSSYGSFAVGIGIGASRNVSVFPGPSAGAWHHYAFVLDTQAPATEQVIPYVDGQPVAYTKVESGTGAPAFANAALNFMSRGAVELWGAGDLDEVALYDRALSAGDDRQPLPRPAATNGRSPSLQAPARPRSARPSTSAPPAPAIPTGPSPNTNGTSTATGPTRPTPARRRAPAMSTPTRPR